MSENIRLENEWAPTALEICVSQIEQVTRLGQILMIQLKGSEQPIAAEFPSIYEAMKAEQQMISKLPDVVAD